MRERKNTSNKPTLPEDNRKTRTGSIIIRCSAKLGMARHLQGKGAQMLVANWHFSGGRGRESGWQQTLGATPKNSPNVEMTGPWLAPVSLRQTLFETLPYGQTRFAHPCRVCGWKGQWTTTTWTSFPTWKIHCFFFLKSALQVPVKKREILDICFHFLGFFLHHSIAVPAEAINSAELIVSQCIGWLVILKIARIQNFSKSFNWISDCCATLTHKENASFLMF